MTTTQPTTEPAAIPTADDVVRAALTAACDTLRGKCLPQQLEALDQLVFDAPSGWLGEQELRQGYELLRRVVTRNRALAADARDVAEPAAYTLQLPWPRPPLNRNGGRGHPIARSKVVKDIRKAGWALAKERKIPLHDHIVVRLHYAPGRRQAQDPMNWTDTTKALIDGFRDAGVIADDDTRHVTEIEPQILFPPEKGPRCWLTIFGV